MWCGSRPEAAALLAAGLLLAACERRAPASDTPAAAPLAARASPLHRLHLAPGVLDEATLRAGEERAYRLDLTAGWYAGLIVDQQVIDVKVSLLAPDGRIVAAVDSNNGVLGPEPLPVVAPVSGRFRLEIVANRAVPVGRYVLRLDALRPAIAHDRARMEAERLLAESVEPSQQSGAVSLRAAVEKQTAALARFRTLALRDREAEALFCLGWSYASLGEDTAARNFYGQALAFSRAQGDEARVGVILTNLGRLERLHGRPEQALAFYREALPLHRRVHNRPQEALTLINAGRAAIDLGESGEALAAFEQALPLCRALGDRRREGLTLSHLGYLEKDLGQPRQALEHLNRALALLKAEGDLTSAGVALARIGVVRALLGHPRKMVLDAFWRALRLQVATGDRQEEAMTLHNLGWYRYRLGEIQQAQRIFRKTLSFFQARDDRAGKAAALLNLGGIDLDLGQPAPAAESFARALALAREIGDPDQEATALLGLARSRRQQGRMTEALAAIDGAFARIETLRRKPANLDLRLTFFATWQEIYELRILLLMQRDRSDPRAGYDERALGASEEARARTLLDRLAAADVRAEGSGAALSSGEIQRQVLEKGTLLIEYSLGRERSFLWAVTSASIESFELPARAVLEEEARRAAFLLEASGQDLARDEAEIALSDLSRRLLGPVAHRLRGGDRLVIVPDGALWSLPFSALPDPAGGAPLVVRHEIVTLPSASVLPRLRVASERSPAPGTIAVLADPVYDAADPRVGRSTAAPPETAGARAVSPIRFERLSYSGIEAGAILSLVPASERFEALGFAASRETVLSGRLARYRIVHFATHAVLDTEHPERSGVALSMVDPAGRPREGFLPLREIYGLRLPADLVVLSACQTGLGREVRGEGLIGLTRGLFSAGARQVLVSLWPVEDRATAELMRRFYAEMLVRRQPPAAALRAAQIAMWRNESRWSPYEWAGFILQGDWRVSLHKPSSASSDLSSRDGRKPRP